MADHPFAALNQLLNDQNQARKHSSHSTADMPAAPALSPEWAGRI